MPRGSSLSIYARASLAAGCRASGLLLEGSWPADSADPDSLALDDLFDARHGWIDDEAARLAQGLAERGLAAGREGWLPWLDNLKLRYFLVRLIRLLAFFEESPGITSIVFHSEGPRDQDYALLLAEISRQDGIALKLHPHADIPTAAPPAMPANPPHRRIAGKLAALLGRWSQGRAAAASGPRVALCGNPSLLDPLAAELAERHAPVAWLWDRFPVQWWRRWRGRVEPLVCDSALGVHNALTVETWGPLLCRGYDLAEPVRQWLALRALSYGPWMTRLVERMDEQLARWRPDVLVLDEDSTPIARAATAVARAQEVPVVVLQHGAPYVRFGYAPLAADRVCVWGEASRDRFLAFGVPPECIAITGSPKHDVLAACVPTGVEPPTPRALHVLILATLPPADDRPDSVALHFTSATHRGMLRAALGGLAGLHGAHIRLKLHPRLPSEHVFQTVLAEYPAMQVDVIRGGDLASLVSVSDVVLSCASSAGIESAWWGKPVIEILPVGGEEPLPAAAWGLVGAARTAEEVALLITQAIRHPAVRPSPRVFANLQRPAVEQILDVVKLVAHTSEPLASRRA